MRRSPEIDLLTAIPKGSGRAELVFGAKRLSLTNLEKIYWPGTGETKLDLLLYYARIAPVLLPHLTARAMVMKRYPEGIEGEFFFMKRAPKGRPEWVETCAIRHASASVIDFPVVNDLPSLLWIVNLGCIDLNPWYARCDDTSRPDYLHFDLDPVPDAGFDRVLSTAVVVRRALDSLRLRSFAKTTGSRGIHIYVPIVRGPLQKEVWTVAKRLALQMQSEHPNLITAEYRKARRPAGRVLVDYNQNAWGRTLASVYSVRPRPGAPVSTPVTWEEIERGFRIEDFHMRNVPDRVAAIGDLWKPITQQRGRCRIDRLL